MDPTSDRDETFEDLLDIQSYSDDQLRALAERLQTEEREVSKRRRILHGKIDILRAEMVRRLRDKHDAGGSLFSEGDVDRLSAILSQRQPPADL